jgi:hypothetical protein
MAERIGRSVAGGGRLGILSAAQHLRPSGNKPLEEKPYPVTGGEC